MAEASALAPPPLAASPPAPPAAFINALEPLPAASEALALANAALRADNPPAPPAAPAASAAPAVATAAAPIAAAPTAAPTPKLEPRLPVDPPASAPTCGGTFATNAKRIAATTAITANSLSVMPALIDV